MWNSMREEVRELVWLASMVGGLSALGVVVAVALTLVTSRLTPGSRFN